MIIHAVIAYFLLLIDSTFTPLCLLNDKGTRFFGCLLLHALCVMWGWVISSHFVLDDGKVPKDSGVAKCFTNVF